MIIFLIHNYLSGSAMIRVSSILQIDLQTIRPTGQNGRNNVCPHTLIRTTSSKSPKTDLQRYPTRLSGALFSDLMLSGVFSCFSASWPCAFTVQLPTIRQMPFGNRVRLPTFGLPCCSTIPFQGYSPTAIFRLRPMPFSASRYC